ncbi:type II toxin-antitoxin system RelE/ParE family toxin [Taklimakanibacter lacteus]|uniref:type II toxin-antitoxin system RelE/ParE family toxin n=1 Tax=Taklimakanibacter lacteus TaxID=2268456 RepID=UPI000E664DA5
MIKSFKNKVTEAAFNGQAAKGFPANILEVARRKLRMVHRAARLEDLKVPPNNRLERLRGDRDGQYSIRVNDQYRICFRWVDNNAEEVEFVDYH